MPFSTIGNKISIRPKPDSSVHLGFGRIEMVFSCCKYDLLW